MESGTAVSPPGEVANQGDTVIFTDIPGSVGRRAATDGAMMSENASEFFTGKLGSTEMLVDSSCSGKRILKGADSCFVFAIIADRAPLFGDWANNRPVAAADATAHAGASVARMAAATFGPRFAPNSCGGTANPGGGRKKTASRFARARLFGDDGNNEPHGATPASREADHDFGGSVDNTVEADLSERSRAEARGGDGNPGGARMRHETASRLARARLLGVSGNNGPRGGGLVARAAVASSSSVDDDDDSEPGEAVNNIGDCSVSGVPGMVANRLGSKRPRRAIRRRFPG